MFNRGRFRSRSIPTVNAADMHTNSQSPSSPGGNPSTSGTTPTFNEAVIDRIENIIGNALMGRADMFKKLFDPRRDVDEECGFPKGEITPQMYQDLFDRDSISARVVEVLPEESWQTTPTVYESEDTEDITQFEDTWDNLSKQLRGSSHYQDEEGSPIWEYLCRADKLSGIGQYGVILLGLDDGLPLNIPVQTWEDRKPDNTYPGATGGYTHPASSVTSFGQDHTGVGTDAQYQSQYSPIYPTGDGKIATRDNAEDDSTKGGKGKGVKGKADKGKVGSKATPKDTFLQTPDSGSPGKKTEDVQGKLMQSGKGEDGEEKDTNLLDSNDPTNPTSGVNGTVGVGKGDNTDTDTDTDNTPSDQSSPGDEPDYQLEDDDSELEESDESEEGDSTGSGLTPSEIELIVKGISGGPINPNDLESVGLLGEDGEPLDTDGQYLGPKYEPRVNITFIRVFPQAQAQITQYERDIHSPRFGQPVMYMITFNDPRMQHSGTGLPIASQNVHWTRILHIADNLTSSEVFGVERMRPVLNNLLSLKKLYPGSAEMYWRGAFPGYSLETNPQLGGDVAIDADATRDMMEDYTNGLQRFLLLMGMSAKSLAPQVVDPTPQINVQLEAICIKLGIPIRVFKGSERGELASSQDDEAWNDRLKKRQQQYITPRIIVPFVDRLINIGVLPQPKGFSVAWQDLDSLNDSEKATNANTKTTALAAYISGSCESLITPKDYLVHFMQFTDEQAESMIEAAKKEVDDKQEEQQALADEHGMVPTPPEGFQHDPENLPPGIAPDGSPLPQSPSPFGGQQAGQPGASNPPAFPPKQAANGGPTGKNGPNTKGSSGGIDPGKFGEKLKPNPIPNKPPKQSKPVVNEIIDNEYNPDEPRDEKGRFTTGGSGSKGVDSSKNAPMASFPMALPHDAHPMALPVHVPEAIPVHSGQDKGTTGEGTQGTQSTSSPGDKAQSLKDKATALFTKGKAKLSGVGKAVYDKLPKPIQKVVDVGQAIEHGLEGAYHSGQKLAKEVAAQRGGDEKHVERVGKYLAWGDGVSRWTANIPVVHEALHVVAHIGGPVGFIGAKVGYYVPVASLGYIGYSMGREAIAKKNPFAMVSRARKAMQAKAAQSQAEHH